MQKKKEFLMVGIGEILWDMLPRGKQLGGAPANFAYHATQLGNKGVVVSCVGRDDDGVEILKTLEKKEVGHYITSTDRYPTGVVTVSMDEQGIPSYIIHEDVAWDHLALNQEHLDLAARADVVCYGTLAQRNSDSAESIRNFLSHTSSECIRLFDINLRHHYDRATILTLLQTATILKLNDEELLVVREFLDLEGDETTVLEALCTAYDLELIILTKGGQGSRLFSPELGDSVFEGEAALVVDTVGAGDSFAAAVATGLCMQLPLEKIHPFAAKVAAYVCGFSGATPELPPLEELL
ncbi:carbohydrate kinase family protein [Desulfopila inferna]|uniref:carbohydrate kinase family protein n=1 Tax=Desulfopila inferna TaxID=468528 RepID=UPI00196368CA|nr:carbohydrate kinase [Desulfopila inferna]MBM9605605.1 carbohydrate kinase [Desulfopila inferna]